MICPIPVSTFEAIKPDELIIVIESPKAIAERLELRDRKIYDKQLLANMQESEIQSAKQIANALKISLHTIHSEDKNKFAMLLRKGIE